MNPMIENPNNKCEMQKLKRFIQQGQCYRPDEPIQVVWSALISLIILYFIAESILVTFFLESRMYIHVRFTVPYSIMILLLLLEIFVTFTRGVYVGGLLRLDRQTVVRQYTKFSIYIDLLIIILLCLSVYLKQYWADVLRLAIFFKLSDLIRFDQVFFRLIHTHRLTKQLYLLLKLIMAVFLVSHILGCIFFYIDYKLIQASYYGSAAENPAVYWLTSSACFEGILGQPDQQQYLYSLYFSVSLITTVAYGDITAKNPIESIYVIIILMISTISISLVLEEIVGVLVESVEQLIKFIKNLSTMIRFMKARNVPKNTQRSIRTYLEYLSYQENYRNVGAEKIVIKKLPKRLRNQLFDNEYYRYFKSINIFGRFPPALFGEIFQQTTEINFAQSQTIVKPFETNGILIFLEKGSMLNFCKYDMTAPKKYVKNAKKQSIYNSVNFVTGAQSQLGIQAKQQCAVVKLNRADFIEKTKQFRTAYQIMCQGRSDALQQRNPKTVGEFCHCCQSRQHNILFCPQCHYIYAPPTFSREGQNFREVFRRKRIRIDAVRQKPVKYMAFDRSEEMAKEYINKKWNQLRAIRSELESGEEVKLYGGRVEFKEIVWFWEEYRVKGNLEFDEEQ